MRRLFELDCVVQALRQRVATSSTLLLAPARTVECWLVELWPQMAVAAGPEYTSGGWGEGAWKETASVER